MSNPLSTQGNAYSVRSVARVCLLPLLVSSLFACSLSSSSNDPNVLPATAAEAIVTPSTVTVSQGRSVTVRVDVKDPPASASVAGFSSDLPETVADIDIATQPCPFGAGTVTCQDWTITPGANSIPGNYNVDITPRGATVPGIFVPDNLTIRVLAAPLIATASAVAVDSSRGEGSIFRSLVDHAVFITADGGLWGLGANHSGAVLGSYIRTDLTGTVVRDVQPRSISEVVSIAGISSGIWTSVVAVVASNGNYSYALRADGTMWRWGGVKHLSISLALVPVMQSVVGIKAISAIDHDSRGSQFLVLDTAGQVYGGGSSDACVG